LNTNGAHPQQRYQKQQFMRNRHLRTFLDFQANANGTGVPQQQSLTDRETARKKWFEALKNAQDDMVLQKSPKTLDDLFHWHDIKDKRDQYPLQQNQRTCTSDPYTGKCNNCPFYNKNNATTCVSCGAGLTKIPANEPTGGNMSSGVQVRVPNTTTINTDSTNEDIADEQLTSHSVASPAKPSSTLTSTTSPSICYANMKRLSK
jgi:hypothetical protein